MPPLYESEFWYLAGATRLHAAWCCYSVSSGADVYPVMLLAALGPH